MLLGNEFQYGNEVPLIGEISFVECGGEGRNLTSVVSTDVKLPNRAWKSSSASEPVLLWSFCRHQLPLTATLCDRCFWYRFLATAELYFWSSKKKFPLLAAALLIEDLLFDNLTISRRMNANCFKQQFVHCVAQRSVLAIPLAQALVINFPRSFTAQYHKFKNYIYYVHEEVRMEKNHGCHYQKHTFKPHIRFCFIFNLISRQTEDIQRICMKICTVYFFMNLIMPTNKYPQSATYHLLLHWAYN